MHATPLYNLSTVDADALLDASVADSFSAAPCLQLAALTAGACASITSINVSDSLKPRLQAMGIKVGAVVKCVRRAPFNGPLHLRVGLTDLIIRKQDAACLNVQLISA